MPGGDGTGPPGGWWTAGGDERWGAGARGWGYRRGRGRRRGFRMIDRPGWARGDRVGPAPPYEGDPLIARLRQLESAIDAINGRLDQMMAGQQRGNT